MVHKDGIIRATGFCALLGSLALASACGGRAESPQAGLIRQARQLFGVLPEVMATPENPATPEKVALGGALFWESRVSIDGTVSCARCHPLSLYAADGLPKSVGNRCRVTPRNAPTVLNAAAQISAHWAGERTSVEDQAERSLVGAASFGMPSNEAAAARLKAIPAYADLFHKAFPAEADPVTAKNFGLAVGAFERTLVTPSPFDDFLEGRRPGLSEGQELGLRAFIETGCANCHSGTYLGGQSYQKFGVAEPYWKRTASPEIDEGRYGVTKAETDRYVFKVPVLRNVEMTGPYFHDGSVARLPDAVWIMGKVQLGTDLTEAGVAEIVAFLKALTGRLAPGIFAVPVLPAGEAVDPPAPKDEAKTGLSPNEDLMQEHALLERLLLVYEEIARRLEKGGEIPPGVLDQTAGIIRRFIEQYHEKDEEEHVFPRFTDGGLAGLVKVLLEQHAAGRALTDSILARAKDVPSKDPAGRAKLVEDIRAFIRMYRPHASREGSVLFPAFRDLLPAKEFLALGDEFEAKEHEVLGAEGFEGQVLVVAEIEERLGIYDLTLFTPR